MQISWKMTKDHGTHARMILLAGCVAISFLFGCFLVCDHVMPITVFLIIVLLGSIFVKPEIGLALVVSTVPMMNMRLAYHPEDPRLGDFLFPLALIPIAMTLIAHLARQPLLRRAETDNCGGSDHLIDILLFLFLGFAVTSLVWTVDVSRGLQAVVTASLAFIILRLLPGLIRTKRSLRHVTIVLAVVGVFIALQLLLSIEFPAHMYTVNLTDRLTFTLTLEAQTAGVGRPGGIASPNIAANIFVIFIFFNIMLAYCYGWRVRILLFLQSALLSYCILKTASKSGLLCLLTGLLLFAVAVPELRKRAVRILVPTAIAVAVLTLLVGGGLMKRIQAMASGTSEGGFLSDRIELWTRGFSYLYESLGLGLGAGGFSCVSIPPYAHNAYLSVLFDYGVIGFIIFLFLIAAIVHKVFLAMPRIHDRELKIAMYCLICSATVTALYALVDISLTYLPIWLVLGLMLAVIGVSEHEGVKQRDCSGSAQGLGNNGGNS